MAKEEIKKSKKMRRISDSLYRKYARRDTQLLKVRAMIREAWRILKQVE
jgi:hypothetical protein